MRRLLIDTSHVLKACLHAAERGENTRTVEHEGKQVVIPDAAVGYEIFLSAYTKCMADTGTTPANAIFVLDGMNAKAERRKIYPQYCVRPKGHPDWFESYKQCLGMIQSTLLSYGAIFVSKDGVEADDIIGALAPKMDCVIWSGDQDLLAYGETYYKSEWNPGWNLKFANIDKQYLKVYKALVGDSSDKLPGAKGFGPDSFLAMLTEFGEDALADLQDMLENRTLDELADYVDRFPKFKTILADTDTVYRCYDCIKLIHPGYTDLDWQMRYPAGDGTFPQFQPEMILVTSSNYAVMLERLRKDIDLADLVSFDIEGDTGEESKAWSKACRSKSDKSDPIDIMGQELGGFSLNCGLNNKVTYYFSIDHADTDNISLKQAESVLNMLPEDKPLAIHNINFELVVVRNHFELKFDRGFLPANSVDTSIMMGIVDEYSNEFATLKDLSSRYLQYKQQSYEEVLDGRTGMREVTGLEVLHYGGDDSAVTSPLYRLFTAIMAYEDTLQHYEEVDKGVHQMYAESFINGIRLSETRRAELQAENFRKLAIAEEKISAFLSTLEWIEEIIPEEAPAPEKVTLGNLEAIKAQIKAAREAGPQEKQYITHKWAGAEFVPAEKMTPSEIKRLFQIYTGAELDSKARSVEVLAMTAGTVDKDFGTAVSDGLEALNSLVAKNFSGKPELNLRSPTQMSKLLYEALAFPVRIRNKVTAIQRSKGQKQGNPSSNEDAIAHAIIYDAADRPELKEFLETIITAKEYLTEESLYFGPYKNLPHWRDNFVHAHSGQSKAMSGRANYSRPNLSQIAKESQVRSMILPSEDDHVIVSFDESGQELVHTAQHSQDANMLSCFIGDNKRDMHSMTGVGIYGMTHDQISYEEFMAIRKDDSHSLHKEVTKARRDAKPVSFLDLYMGTKVSLAVDLRIPEEQAEAMLEEKNKAFPGIRIWQESEKQKMRDLGYSVEPTGRRRHLHLDGSWRDEHQLRSGLNHKIQGGAASQIKLIMRAIWESRVMDRLRAYFMFSVHDQVVFSVHRDDVLEFVKVVHPFMTQPYAGFTVPFNSSIDIGPNFYSLKELGETIDEEKIKITVRSCFEV